MPGAAQLVNHHHFSRELADHSGLSSPPRRLGFLCFFSAAVYAEVGILTCNLDYGFSIIIALLFLFL